jgi:hypothetical protein
MAQCWTCIRCADNSGHPLLSVCVWRLLAQSGYSLGGVGTGRSSSSFHSGSNVPLKFLASWRESRKEALRIGADRSRGIMSRTTSGMSFDMQKAKRPGVSLPLRHISRFNRRRLITAPHGGIAARRRDRWRAVAAAVPRCNS